MSSPSSSTMAALFHHAMGPSPCSAIEHYLTTSVSLYAPAQQPKGSLQEKKRRTQTIYGALFGSRFSCTPSAALGGPGSSSQNSSDSTRTRTASPWSMYMRSATGVSSSSVVVFSSESGSQKWARSFGSLLYSPKINAGYVEGCESLTRRLVVEGRRSGCRCHRRSLLLLSDGSAEIVSITGRVEVIMKKRYIRRIPSSSDDLTFATRTSDVNGLNTTILNTTMEGSVSIRRKHRVNHNRAHLYTRETRHRI
jgi:hypothetical protein